MSSLLLARQGQGYARGSASFLNKPAMLRLPREAAVSNAQAIANIGANEAAWT